MVYGGKPSRGCYTCRKRKIKCDEGTPECSRCLRIGKKCLGYRDPNTVVFRSENKTAKLNVLKRRQAHGLFLRENDHATPSGGSSLYKSEDESVSFVPFTDEPSRSVSPYPPQGCVSFPQVDILTGIGDPLFHNLNSSASRRSHMPAYSSDPCALNSTPPLAPDLDFVALCQFFHRYVVPFDQIRISHQAQETFLWLDFLVNLYQESGELSPMRRAVQAISFAHLANQSDDEELGVKARQVYGDALQAVNSALRDSEQQLEDGTLTAVYLLIYFDTIQGTERTIQSTHGAGLNSLLQLRGSRQFATRRGRSLHHTVVAHLLGRTLVQRTHPPPYLIKWLTTRDKDGTVNLSHELLRVAQICAGITDLLPPRANKPHSTKLSHERSARLLDLLQEASDVDDRFAAQYSSTVVPLFRFRDTTQPLGSHAPILPRTAAHPVHVYANSTIALRWNAIRTTRLVLQHTVLSCTAHLSTLHALPNHTAQSWRSFECSTFENSTRTIDLIIGDIVASAPFVIGEIDAQGRPLPQLAGKVPGGVPLQWALWTSIECPFASRERNGQARAAMERLGSVLGFRKAMMLARVGVREG